MRRVYGFRTTFLTSADCLSSSNYDSLLNDEVNPYPTDTIDDEGYEMGFGGRKGESPLEHPCLALKKILSSGTFYYSSDFDLTRRLQERYGRLHAHF